MSWATCYYNKNACSNNIHFNKPPLVSDGRLFTAYDSSAATMAKIKEIEKLYSNWSYRQYLQNNAMEIMKYNNLETYIDNGINPGITFGTKGNTPILYKSNEEYVKPPPFGYCKGDLKNYYLSREELNNRLLAPSININNM